VNEFEYLRTLLTQENYIRSKINRIIGIAYKAYYVLPILKMFIDIPNSKYTANY
jgi:hypothetical protein